MDKPAGAEKQGALTRRGAWRRTFRHVCDHIQRPEWMRADAIDSVKFIAIEISRELAYCGYPLIIPTKVSGELFQLPNLDCARRMDSHE